MTHLRRRRPPTGKEGNDGRDTDQHVHVGRSGAARPSPAFAAPSLSSCGRIAADGNIKGQMLGVNGSQEQRRVSRQLSDGAGNATAIAGGRRIRPRLRRRLDRAGARRRSAAQLKLRTFDQDTLSGPESQVSTRRGRAADHGPPWRVWPTAASSSSGPTSGGTSASARSASHPTERKTAPSFAPIPFRDCTGVPHGGRPGQRQYRDRMAGAPRPARFSVHLQIFDANGPVGGEQTTSLDVTEAAMTALDSGRFVIAHIQKRIRRRTRLRYDGRAGQRVRADRRFRQHPVCRHRRAADPVLLADARAAVRRTLPPGVDPAQRRQRRRRASNVKARIFSQPGPIGQPTQFNTSTGSQRSSLCAATTNGPDGETAFAAWTDDSQTGADPSGRAVPRGRPLTISPGGGF